MKNLHNHLSIRWLLISAISLLLASCYYPKVTVSKEEKASIVYPNKSKHLFTNKNGDIDTVQIAIESRRGFEPNFDFWWSRKISQNDTISTRRRFGKTFNTYPNFEHDEFKKANINLSLRLDYDKNENDDGVVLHIDRFRESYVLNKVVGDSLVFKDLIHENPETCPTNVYCVVRVIYHKKKGIILVEKGNGEIWTLR